MKQSTPANQYAWAQLQSSLPARGAVLVVDGLRVTATFGRVHLASLAELALGTKYPKDGPQAVWFSRLDDFTLRFEFKVF